MKWILQKNTKLTKTPWWITAIQEQSHLVLTHENVHSSPSKIPTFHHKIPTLHPSSTPLYIAFWFTGRRRRGRIKMVTKWGIEVPKVCQIVTASGPTWLSVQWIKTKSGAEATGDQMRESSMMGAAGLRDGKWLLGSGPPPLLMAYPKVTSAAKF